jgi:hypothetical protein
VCGKCGFACADDDMPSLEGSWRITISAPRGCQGAPPACIAASEFSNFYPGGTLTETNTILFAASEPNPPNFSSGSDGYGTWRRTDTPNVYTVRFEKFLFQTQSVPTYVSQPGDLLSTRRWPRSGGNIQSTQTERCQAPSQNYTGFGKRENLARST